VKKFRLAYKNWLRCANVIMIHTHVVYVTYQNTEFLFTHK